MEEICICGHYDTSHDMRLEHTGILKGCMEYGCECYGYSVDDPDDPINKTLLSIEAELRSAGYEEY